MFISTLTKFHVSPHTFCVNSIIRTDIPLTTSWFTWEIFGKFWLCFIYSSTSTLFDELLRVGKIQLDHLKNKAFIVLITL